MAGLKGVLNNYQNWELAFDQETWRPVSEWCHQLLLQDAQFNSSCRKFRGDWNLTKYTRSACLIFLFCVVLKARVKKLKLKKWQTEIHKHYLSYSIQTSLPLYNPSQRFVIEIQFSSSFPFPPSLPHPSSISFILFFFYCDSFSSPPSPLLPLFTITPHAFVLPPFYSLPLLLPPVPHSIAWWQHERLPVRW